MRKDWIRTEEEVQLRQLQKLAKEQKKSSSGDAICLNLPLVVRTKKKLKIKSTPSQSSLVKSVNHLLVFNFV